MRFLFSLLFLASPAIAQQEVICTYTVECVEGESCGDTDFAVTVRNEPDSDSAMTLITDVETLRGGGIQREGPAHAMFAGKTAMHMVSVTRVSGVLASRYTIHMEGPLAITYHGTCEGAE